MNILVTGANGFLGSNICNTMSQNHNIFAVSRNFHKLTKNNTVFFHLDMCDYNLLSKIFKDYEIDAVVHCSWMGGNSSKDSNELWQIKNIFHSIQLLDFCVKNRVKHFIGLGSSAEFGEQILKFDENTICKPNNMYGIAKYSFKQISDLFCNKNDINYTWVRPIYTYGPYDVETRLIPKTIISLLKNEKLILNECSNTVDYLYVQDFVNAIKIIIEKKIYGDYIICSDKEYRISDVVNVIYNHIKPDLDIVFDKNLSQVGPPYICGSSAKFKSITNWTVQYNFNDGIDKTINYYKNFV